MSAALQGAFVVIPEIPLCDISYIIKNLSFARAVPRIDMLRNLRFFDLMFRAIIVIDAMQGAVCFSLVLCFGVN